MASSRSFIRFLIPTALACSLTGCTGVAPTPTASLPALTPSVTSGLEEPATENETAVQQVGHLETSTVTADVTHEESPFAGQAMLSLSALVEEVLKRNPSLAEMTAAWQAAAARYPQVVSLEDPMAGVTLGPGSIGSDMVEFGYRIDVSQKLPFPGKLRLKGEAATAEASAALHDIDETRLTLVESARTPFMSTTS